MCTRPSVIIESHPRREGRARGKAERRFGSTITDELGGVTIIPFNVVIPLVFAKRKKKKKRRNEADVVVCREICILPPDKQSVLIKDSLMNVHCKVAEYCVARTVVAIYRINLFSHDRSETIPIARFI